MHQIRRLVELVLYGTGDQRRFVQDGAVYFEVWIEMIQGNGSPVGLLLQPYMDLPPGEVARGLVAAGIRVATHRLAYNNTLVSLFADIATLACRIVPLTHWWARAVTTKKKRVTAPYAVAKAALRDGLWSDLPLVDVAERVGTDVPPELHSFIRIAGVVAWLALVEKDDTNGVQRATRLLDELTELEPAIGRERVVAIVRAGWDALEKLCGATPAPASLVYSITCDRKAFLAVADSRKTVKADAAQALFGMSCRNITWAVIDSGIDATHPALAEAPDPKKSRAGAESPKSRVRHTYELTWLNEILTGFSDVLPPRFKRPELAEQLKLVRQRAEDFKPIDWGQMLPLLELAGEHYEVPTDRHGTHVAGILGADWPDGPRGPMLGVTRDIGLLDVRVCKPDGSSTEFVITAALQLLRYLNAHADMMAVHGVNMSLSLEHDVANYACGRTPVCLEAERAIGAGIVVVAAAGNRGYRHIRAADETTFYQFCAVSITDPGNARGVITVGSTHRREPHNFGVSYFSSRGPTGDGRIKPDLVAPGEKIFAPSPGKEAVTLDGTSMAAPHVSGAAALLMARNPELIGQPERIKQILCASATDLGRERYFQGHGLLDVLRALQSV